MYKTVLSLLSIVSLAHATEPPLQDITGGDRNPGLTSQNFVQPNQGMEEIVEIDSHKKHTVQALGDMAKHETKILELKATVEIERAKNDIKAQALRTEILAKEIEKKSKAKLEKLKEKSKKKKDKMKRKLKGL